MDIIALFESFKRELTQLQEALVNAEEASKALAKLEYDKGFADGVASVGGGDKIYTQADLDAAVAAAVEPINAQVAAMQEEIAGLHLKIADLENGLEVGKQEAVAAFKAELLAKYQEQQVAETAGETGFEGLLK